MFKFLAKIIFYFLKILDDILFLIFKKNFRYYLYDFLRDNYSTLNFNSKKAKFFTPSTISKWRINTFFEKEPETLDFIDNMKNNGVFFDIGANTGIYSIYAGIQKSKLKVFAFEPSATNLALLSRNIFLNNLSKRISIVQLPLSNQKLQLNTMNEGFVDEGGSMNSYGVSHGFDGKKYNPINKYRLLGTSIDFLIDQKIIPKPNYIKLDVDGIEHLILSGGLKCLKYKGLKKIIIEINENFKKQFMSVKTILKKNGFKALHKKRAENFYNSKKFKKTFNYIFER